VGMAKRGELFGKDLLGTGALFTEKATEMQYETDRTPTSWKVS
jgi:hypothetical protein